MNSSSPSPSPSPPLILHSPPPALYPRLALFLEPHLPLIKSRTLNAFYSDLRYERGTQERYIPTLLQEAQRDYRLARLLRNLDEFIVKHHPNNIP